LFATLNERFRRHQYPAEERPAFSSMHSAAVRSVATLMRDGEPLVITPQIVAEFWNVATRPVEQNGLGWSHQQTLDEIARIEGFLSVLIESAEVYDEWKRLVVAVGVTGVQAHDARLWPR